MHDNFSSSLKKEKELFHLPSQVTMKRKAGSFINQKLTLVFVADGCKEIEVKTATALAHFKLLNKMLKDVNDVDDRVEISSDVSLDGFKFCYDFVKDGECPKKYNVASAYEALVAGEFLLFDYMDKLYESIGHVISLDLTNKYNIDQNWDIVDVPIRITEAMKKPVEFRPDIHPKQCWQVPKDILTNFIFKKFSYRDYRHAIEGRPEIASYIIDVFKRFIMKHLEKDNIEGNPQDVFDLLIWTSQNHIKSYSFASVFGPDIDAKTNKIKLSHSFPHDLKAMVFCVVLFKNVKEAEKCNKEYMDLVKKLRLEREESSRLAQEKINMEREIILKKKEQRQQKIAATKDTLNQKCQALAPLLKQRGCRRLFEFVRKKGQSKLKKAILNDTHDVIDMIVTSYKEYGRNCVTSNDFNLLSYFVEKELFIELINERQNW